MPFNDFFFFNILDIKLDEKFPECNEKDIVIGFNNLLHLSTELMNDFSSNKVKLIFSNLINISRLLELKDEEIIESALHKIEKNFKRFEIDY